MSLNVSLKATLLLPALFIAPAAVAQFVPSVPPPPAAPAPYEAPPKPEAKPTPPPAPVEPDFPPFSLIERDDAGKIKPVSGPIEEAAVLKVIDSLPAEKQEKVRQVIADRAARVEQKLAAAAPLALKIYTELPSLTGNNDQAALTNFGEQMRNIMTSPSLLQNLQAQQAISFKQFSAIDKAAKEYTKAVNKQEAESEGPGNIPAIIRRTLRNNSAEPFRALEIMLGKATGEWKGMKNGLEITSDAKDQVAAAEAELAAASDTKAKAMAMAKILKALSDDQKIAMLSAMATPVESKPESKPAEAKPAEEMNK